MVDVRYRAHDGYNRHAWLLLPAWYGPMRHARIPLVISPHGRGGGDALEHAPAARAPRAGAVAAGALGVDLLTD
jgi:hypothetical protein